MDFKKASLIKLENYFFYILLLFALSIIIIPKFYLTGDGPSHIYNAKIFVDYLFNNNRNFYKPFFEINRNLDPNWTTQIILSALIKIFPYWLAEKMFQILYVCLFTFGLRYLLKACNCNTLFALFFYPFCFTITFQQGFYNYSLALSFLFFLTGYFYLHRKKWNGLSQSVFTIGALIIALTHGMVATHFIILCFLILIFDAIDLYNQKKSIQEIFNQIAPSKISLLPAILIIISFTLRQGLSITPHRLTKFTKFINFIQLYCCKSTLLLENIPAIILAIGIFILSIIIFIKYKCQDVLIRNVFLLFAIYTFIAYINSPNTLGYAGAIDIRLAFLPPLFLLLALSTYLIPTNFQKIILLFAVFIQISFLCIRFPSVISASNEIKKIIQLENKIETQKTLLSVQYNTYGSKKQMQIDNSFLHVFNYVGALPNKQIIDINNIEADFNYFTMRWRKNYNPRNCMPNIANCKAPQINELLKYETQINSKIDYILFQNDVSILDSTKTNFQNYLQSNYNKMDSIPDLEIDLWKKK